MVTQPEPGHLTVGGALGMIELLPTRGFRFMVGIKFTCEVAIVVFGAIALEAEGGGTLPNAGGTRIGPLKKA